MQSFDDYHDTMLAIALRAEGYLTAECPRDTAALDLCRARMSRILTAYHLFADRELFTPCLSVGDPAQRLHVRAIAAECAALAQDVRAYNRHCALRPVTDDWADHRQRVFAMIARLRRHLVSAKREVRRCEGLMSGQSPAAGHSPVAAAAAL